MDSKIDNEKLQQLRELLRDLDYQMLDLLRRRLLLARQIGKIKKAHSIPIHQPQLEIETIELYARIFADIDPEVIHAFMSVVMRLSIDTQTRQS